MDEIKQLKIVDGEKNLFSHDSYLIPIYQRPFAWEEEEISQLIEDIDSFDANHYYLGSLIVQRKDNGIFEVIDGQQRLTALFLLLVYLGYEVPPESLRYECRDKANATLAELAKSHRNIELSPINENQFDQSLIEAYLLIDKRFQDIDRAHFQARLSRVSLYRILVPPHTDLNRYFEIMNVRGEQLEPSDILKAKLMEPLPEEEKTAFAKVWDAVREMDGYVQMAFPKQDRESLFGGSWNQYPDGKVLAKLPKTETTTGSAALDIIKSDKTFKPAEVSSSKRTEHRYKSIIDFPHFLIYSLFVFEKANAISIDESKQADDKKLVPIFDAALAKWKESNKSPADFSRQFISCLLQLRFLFDQYIIKRESLNGDSENGVWSLQTINVSGAKNKKKGYPVKTSFKPKNKQNKTYEKLNNQVLMLESCLRVSYTSAKSMDWLAKALYWLYRDRNADEIDQFIDCLNDFAKKKVGEYLKGGDYYLGVNTPHIVLNYLDYLLWLKLDREKYKSIHPDDFTFEFRNSVEHWYPQRPSDDTFGPWEDKTENGKYRRDGLGNLCLVNVKNNSKFSNLSPASKKESYKETIDKGSLKLQLMADKTSSTDDWRDHECQDHSEGMIALLKQACDPK